MAVKARHVVTVVGEAKRPRDIIAWSTALCGWWLQALMASVQQLKYQGVWWIQIWIRKAEKTEHFQDNADVVEGDVYGLRSLISYRESSFYVQWGLLVTNRWPMPFAGTQSIFWPWYEYIWGFHSWHYNGNDMTWFRNHSNFVCASSLLAPLDLFTFKDSHCLSRASSRATASFQQAHLG